ncbi:DUF4399 domain-containing protein [Kordiimonas sp.]|uniref:DUF4399 domain-containing protein n=1 Tax=Kordiimonas sp. TaxID=1970157 RepID=UPI003A92F214
MKKMLLSLTLATMMPLGGALASDATPSAPDAEVYFISPTDGATVTNPITVRFGLKGMGIAPAGTERENTGHHHLLINTDIPPLDENIPMDDQHVHFGGGQTETTIKLAPGQHTLQLLLGDMYHLPHDPAVFSQKITITVTE